MDTFCLQRAVCWEPAAIFLQHPGEVSHLQAFYPLLLERIRWVEGLFPYKGGPMGTPPFLQLLLPDSLSALSEARGPAHPGQLGRDSSFSLLESISVYAEGKQAHLPYLNQLDPTSFINQVLGCLILCVSLPVPGRLTQLIVIFEII